jgi:TP901 family phage tail tape measure protein
MDLTDFTKGLQDAQKELKTQGDAFKNAGEFMSKAFTLPLAGIATASAMAFAGFEQSMNKVLALGGKDVADMFGDLQKQALQLGADTKYSAKQAADAMGELAAAGFKGNEIMKAMPGLLSLAATENMKLADAARIASSVLKGFGIDASRMGDVADILAKTAAMSAVSIQDLGYSFQYIGPAARAAGQSFMDISAALAVLGNAGIRGESAGTALRNMLNDLMTPTKAVAGALDALKINSGRF